MLVEVLVIASAVWMLAGRVFPKPLPYLGIYQRPGIWFPFKALFIYLLIILRKRKPTKNKAGNQSGSGYGVASGKDLETMESAQPLGESKMAVDAVLLSCSGQDGSYLVAAIARRQLKMNNTIFTIRVPGVGVLVHPKHPDTTM